MPPGAGRAARRAPALSTRRALVAACLLAGCASATSGPSITTTAPGGVIEQIPAAIRRPDGPGPFPAVVMLHDCSGLGPASSGGPGRWADELVARGYVVILPDSFTTRGVPGGVCTAGPARGTDVSPERRARDAYAALAHLRTLPWVGDRPVGVMGGSHGGTTTLATMQSPEGGRAGFAGAVSLYPRCTPRPGGVRVDATGVYRPAAPVLILIGEADDWTPAEACRTRVETARRAGQPVAIKTYAGAHHSFDSRNPVRFVPGRINPSAPGGRGATTGGHPEAWADSIREVTAFFDRHLK
jgi:dienelactone hydrolase